MGKAAVVGAGLVGSLWAAYLAQRGYDVDVFERRPDMRKDDRDGGRSINLALSERGIKALAGVGLEKQVRDMCIPMHGRLIHDTHGHTNMQPYGLTGQYINSISRAGLNRLMLDHAEKSGRVTCHFEHKCTDVDLTNAALTLETSTGKEVKWHGDVVFGTDGAFSAVRGNMMRTDRFNYAQQYLEHGYKELSIHPNSDGSFKMEPNALHIWPRKRFMLIALPNQDGSFTCTLFLGFEGEKSFSKLTTEAEVKAFFEEEFPDVIPLMPHYLEEFFTNPTSSLVTVKCFPWAAGGSTLIMGDASHAIVPFYGQGMNAGFEDCTVLNDVLDDYNGDMAAAIHAFEQIRKADTDAIADLAMRNFVEMRDLVADDRFVLRKKVEKLIHQKYPEDFLPLYSMVTFSHTPYAEALATGNAYDAYFKKIDDEELMLVADRPESTQAQTLIDSWYSELKQLHG